MRIDDSRDLLVDVVWLSRISGVEPEISLAFSSKVENEKGNLLPAKPYIKFFLEIDRYVKADWKSLLEHQLQENDGRVNKRILIEIFNSVDYEKLPSDKKKKFENLLLLATSELHVVKIEAIEELQYNDYVYDVSVPNNEMFFAGDIPILLHNSDERGIQTIREKVKDFARTASTGGAPFKIIFLDEADALTRDAQQALRRIMEKYSSNVRFILNCNYSSKIIDPIQSRCAIFRFKPLSKENIITLLKRICEKEKLNVSDKVLDVIANISEGDARRAINLLQAAVATSERITEDTIYEIASEAKPEEIKEVLMMAYEGRFREARDRLIELMLKYGLSGVDVIKSLMKGVWSLPVKDEDKVDIIDKLGEIEFRLVEGSNPHVQLSAFLAYICKFRKKV